MRRCRRTIATALSSPSPVSRMALYGRWSTRPAAASFLTISVTLEGASPSRTASWLGVMGSACHSVCE